MHVLLTSGVNIMSTVVSLATCTAHVGRQYSIYTFCTESTSHRCSVSRNSGIDDSQSTSTVSVVIENNIYGCSLLVFVCCQNQVSSP